MSEHDMASAGVDARGLTKSFGPLPAVRGIDLSIAPGETVALLGPNGAGKSTTIDMILGLSRPDAGTVSVFGQPPDQAVRAGSIGAMLQTGAVVQYLSIRELLHLVASLYPHPLPVGEVLELTGLSDLADRQTTKLSGGQSQRVRFAISLVGDPDLLVLDEPTAALDVEGRHEFWDSMRAVARQGKTVLFATHYLEEADAFADRIVVMAKGRIVADGAPSQIKAKVGTRTIRATAPDLDLAEARRLPGVASADRLGDQIVLTCADADIALYALLGSHAGIRDIEVRGAGLEEAFLELTGHDEEGALR
jgi:ABC-2 type transport system ATP-binding protein